MRSIALKLTLAFALVGLTGAVLVALILQFGVRSAFGRFVQNRDQQVWVDNLVQYYQVHGSWDGISESLPGLLSAPQATPAGRLEFLANLTPFTLVGTDHVVLVSGSRREVGHTLSNAELQNAIPLTVNGQPVGWLVTAPLNNPYRPNSPEGLFLGTINRATLESALVAILLAVALGGLLAYTLTHPLRELTEATNAIARGNFGQQVKVRSKDELGKLSAAFNQMSLDLAHATELRRQMTADIAHDLRTPLSVISGYSEALSDGKLAGTPELYGVLYQETQHLSRLVEDLRTLSLADAGELPLVMQTIPARSLLERVAASHMGTAQQKDVALRIDAGEDLPQISVDPERMAQVFHNLISNALRYTPPGGEVVLAARAEGDEVQLSVHDTGCGIQPEDLPHVFDRFYRGDQARQQTGESGLGLAIGKSIVEAHGGKISVSSTPGQGAVFTITLPPWIGHSH